MRKKCHIEEFLSASPCVFSEGLRESYKIYNGKSFFVNLTAPAA